jgi:glutathione peroxidase
MTTCLPRPSLTRRHACAALAGVLAAPLARAADTCPALWQRRLPRLQDEKPQDLCQFAGKVVVVVNTASYCGFTSQYRGLEALNSRYQSKGLVVLGFPSNDFSQEPGTDKEIAAFCENTFGVKFPMFSKTRVVSNPVEPLYAELKRITGQAPAWNFHKYLVARDGRTVQSFGSSVDPMGSRFLESVDKLLAAS